MSDQLDKILEKLESVGDKVAEIDTQLHVLNAKFEAHLEDDKESKETLIRNTDILSDNTDSLKEHMAQTALLRDYIKKVDDRFTPIEQEAQRKAAVELYTHSKLVLIAKIGGAITGLGAIAGIVKIALSML
jgi:type I site-specific restriction endonuclease